MRAQLDYPPPWLAATTAMMIADDDRKSNGHDRDDGEDLAQHPADADVLLIAVLNAGRLDLLLALFPMYQAMGAKMVMKMPRIPKTKISVPCGCSCGGAPYGWPYGIGDC